MNGPQSDHVVSCKAVRVACKTELSKMRSCLTFLNAFSLLLFFKFLSVLRLCYLMSDAHYNPNETVNSSITGMEMSIITQAKVAKEEIVFCSQISGKTKDMAM